jgi:uncharacterized protein with FMN-binding domain
MLRQIACILSIVATVICRPVEAMSASSDKNGGAHFADGAYTATGQYGGLPSFITVTVTLKNGVITDVTVTPHATVTRSLELQRQFAAAVPRAVVGKPINEVHVGKLAGSSGTPEGFNNAIEKIKARAAQ